MTSRLVEGRVRDVAYRSLVKDRFAGPKRKSESLVASLVPAIRQIAGVCEDNARAIVLEAIETTESDVLVMASDRADRIACSIGEAIARGTTVHTGTLLHA